MTDANAHDATSASPTPAAPDSAKPTSTPDTARSVANARGAAATTAPAATTTPATAAPVALYPTLTAGELRNAQEETLARPRRRYSLAAKALFATMDLAYGKKDTLAKFRVLEIVARVPYQAWEHVGYIAITHTSEAPELARAVHDRVLKARAEQDNEQWHLLILEELIRARKERHGFVRGFAIPQVMAFVYYQLSWLLYTVSPSWSHRLNADFEDHAEHTYMSFVAANPWTDATPWNSAFAQDYGHHNTLGDLLRQIGHDERIHRMESEALIDNARYRHPGT